MFDLETRIVTCDRNDADVNKLLSEYNNIEFVQGDTKDVVSVFPLEKLQQLPHPWLIVEDSHQHVLSIVEHLYPLMESGDYLVIEDIGHQKEGTKTIRHVMETLPGGTFMVDSSYTDFFGRNATCSPDSIFRCTKKAVDLRREPSQLASG